MNLRNSKKFTKEKNNTKHPNYSNYSPKLNLRVICKRTDLRKRWSIHNKNKTVNLMKCQCVWPTISFWNDFTFSFFCSFCSFNITHKNIYIQTHRQTHTHTKHSHTHSKPKFLFMLPNCQLLFIFYCWYFFIAEIIEYSTIIIESALDTDTDKLQPGSIVQHYEIETTPSHNNHTSNEDNDHDHDHDDDEATVTITKVHIEPSTMCSKSVSNHITTTPTTITATTTTIASATRTTMAQRPKEVVSYQRFGRVDKKSITYPFKCHLCGFSCRFKESLLSHFKEVHPY